MKIIKSQKLNIRTSKGIFEIILEKWESDHGYTVRVTQLPEIVTEGDSIEKAKKTAKEAIEFCIGCKKDEHYSDTKGKRSSKIAAEVGV